MKEVNHVFQSNLTKVQNFYRTTKLERIAGYHLFFRTPIDLILVLGPMLVGVSAFTFSDKLVLVENGLTLTLRELHETFLTRFLIGLKAAIFIIIIIFVVFRWSSVQIDGSYGYWVALGIDRQVFFMLSFIVFLRYIYTGVLIGFVMIYLIAGQVIPPLSIVAAFILILSTVLNMFGLAIFIAELIKNPAISAITYAGLLGSIFLLNTRANVLSIMFQSDIIRTDVMVTFFLSTMTGTVLMLLGYWLHQRTDVEL